MPVDVVGSNVASDSATSDGLNPKCTSLGARKPTPDLLKVTQMTSKLGTTVVGCTEEGQTSSDGGDAKEFDPDSRNVTSPQGE